MQPLAFIPSPSQGVWHLGPFPLRAYALMIILGIIVAVWVGERRWTARGGTPGVVVDCAVWAVPFGLVGGRLYHVITDYQRYFGEGRNPVDAFKVWEGGLGIWGAVVLGGVGAWIGCRRRGVSVAALGDAIAPGIALAQGIGRWGNWWNQELYGRPLKAWWAVEIDPAHRPQLADGLSDPKYADVATYHPTFLYESLWCFGVAFFVIWAGRRYKLTHGRTFALYVAAYTVGRAWIEFLRIDDAHHVLGLRLNDWTALVVFIGAVTFLWRTRGHTGPEAVTVTGRYAERAGLAEATEQEPAAAAPAVVSPADERPAETAAATADSAEAGSAEAGPAEVETPVAVTPAEAVAAGAVEPEAVPEPEPEPVPEPEPEVTAPAEPAIAVEAPAEEGAEGGTAEPEAAESGTVTPEDVAHIDVPPVAGTGRVASEESADASANGSVADTGAGERLAEPAAVQDTTPVDEATSTVDEAAPTGNTEDKAPGQKAQASGGTAGTDD